MRKWFVALFCLTISSVAFGQEQKDTIVTHNKWHSNFGMSLYLGASKRNTDLSNSLLPDQTLDSYSSNYKFSPGLYLSFLVTKKWFLIKNELGVSKYSSNESYKVSGYSWAAFHPPYYTIIVKKWNHNYTSLTYRLGMGLELYKFQLIPQVQVNYFFHYAEEDESFNGFIYQTDYISSAGFDFSFPVLIGTSVELNYKISDKWQIGLNAYKQIEHKKINFIISSFQLSVTKKFIKNPKAVKNEKNISPIQRGI